MASSPSKVLFCIGGSIAAYRIADVVSALVKQGVQVKCILGRGGAEFVTPTVLETLSGNPVHTELFGPGVSGTEHIRLARWPDLVVFAPATAHLLARLSLGLADDLITTVALATEAPWLVAPAMNTVMWDKPVTQSHIRTLRDRGAEFIDPASGVLACGEEGAGKLASVETIVERIKRSGPPFQKRWARPFDLAGVRVLITAGPTTSAIDAVRYLTNPSTGRMGAAMAEEALARGAEVVHVLGVDKGVVRPQAPEGTAHRLKIIEVRTAEEMAHAALVELPKAHGVIATAAVLDYRVAESADHKLKRADEPLTLTLLPSADVLAELRAHARPEQWFLGFAAETDEVEMHGAAKLARKRLDYLFANRIARRGESLDTGFGVETNGGTLLRRDREPVRLETQGKDSIARALWNQLARDLAERQGDITHADHSH